MKVFLDDWRPCPSGWEKAEDFNEMIRILSQNKGKIEEVSLDYDLGGVRTGLDVCKWFLGEDYWPPIIRVHSSHGSGVRAMKTFLEANAPETTQIIIYFNV